MVTTRPELLLRTMSVSVALPQPVSVLMSMTPVTIKDYLDAQGLSCRLGYASVQGPHGHCYHADVSGLPCHLGP